MAKDELSEIDKELRWVEDNIPNAPGATLLPSDDLDFNTAPRQRRNSDSKKTKLAAHHGWFASQPGWIQCIIAFVVFFVFMNAIMWLSGTNDEDDVGTERGYTRLVPGRLASGDDDAGSLGGR